jgi:hypothetical protein
MRIKDDTKLIIEFPTRKGLLDFMEKIAGYINISVTGRKVD